MKWDVGVKLRTLRKSPVTRELFREYAEASSDQNPIHLEDAVAKEMGLQGVIMHGMLSMAFMADHVCANFPEDNFRLIRLKSRFRKVTFPGDELTCGGQVKKVHGKKLHLSLWIKNQKAETTTDGEAEVEKV